MLTIGQLARQVGTVGLIILGMLGFYEGIPFVKTIPFIGRVPVLGELAEGRVATEAAKAADAARKGYVLLSEKTAAEARAREMERQAAAASQALEEHRRRLQSAQTSERAAEANLELEIAKNEKLLKAVGRDWRLDDSDIDWVRRH